MSFNTNMDSIMQYMNNIFVSSAPVIWLIVGIFVALTLIAGLVNIFGFGRKQ